MIVIVVVACCVCVVQRRLASAVSLLDDISKEIDFAKRQETVLKDITGSYNRLPHGALPLPLLSLPS
jgi:hypothetical protein